MHAAQALAQQAAGRQPVGLVPGLKGLLRLLQTDLERHHPRDQRSLVEGCVTALTLLTPYCSKLEASLLSSSSV